VVDAETRMIEVECSDTKPVCAIDRRCIESPSAVVTFASDSLDAFGGLGRLEFKSFFDSEIVTCVSDCFDCIKVLADDERTGRTICICRTRWRRVYRLLTRKQSLIGRICEAWWWAKLKIR